MARVFLTHTPEALENYYGERALAGISELGELRFNDSAAPLSSEALIEASAGCEIIVSDRQTPGDALLFDASPNLVAFLRCAVDIRTVDVAAASRNGILVTNASPGFVNAVVELAHNLGMEVVAEGVETEDQLALLQALDCDFAQGHLFSKALSSEKVEELLGNDARFKTAA